MRQEKLKRKMEISPPAFGVLYSTGSQPRRPPEHFKLSSKGLVMAEEDHIIHQAIGMVDQSSWQAI